MKAIILAAGIGSRLKPITDAKPKTLVKVNNKPILGYILDSLDENGIIDVVICTGHKAENIMDFCNEFYSHLNISFVHNQDYQSTNNMFSLYLARHSLDGDILLMNADLVYEPKVIKGLIQQEHTSVAVDKGSYNIESMKVTVTDDFIRHISKKIGEQESYGSSIDIYKVNKEDVIKVVNEMKRIIEVDNELNLWTEIMLDNLFKSGTIKAKPYDINPAKWFEIDNFDDLASAEILFNTKIASLKHKKIYFIDKDGTLSVQNNRIDSASQFIQCLKEKKKLYYVITNNSSKTPLEHLKNIQDMGFEFSEDSIAVSLDSALKFLKNEGFTNLFWVANSRVSKYITEKGFTFDDKKPHALLLTYDTEITYNKIVDFIKHVRDGYPYYATHTDLVCPTPLGPIPDIGFFIEIIKITTGLLPIRTFGKPEKDMIKPILNEHDLEYKDAVIIGDRLYTDIKMALNSNITSVLVLTGETTRADYEFSSVEADIVLNSLKDIVNFV